MARDPTKTITPFSFDRAFDRDTDAKAGPRPPQRRTLTLEEIDAIKREAHAAGLKAAEASHAKRAADGIAQLLGRIAALEGALDEAAKPARIEAVKLAAAIGTRLARALLLAHPAAEIEALVARCIEELKAEPVIVLRLNDGLIDEVKAAAQAMAERQGYGGRLVVIGEPQIPVGDCTVEWADGGLVRDFAGALDQITSLIRSYLEAEGDPDAAETARLTTAPPGVAPGGSTLGESSVEGAA